MTNPNAVITKGNPFKKTKTGLTDLILRGMTRQQPIARERKTYASDAAECPRRAVKFCLSDADTTATMTPSSHLYMGVGTALHEMITDSLFRESKLIFKEYRIPKIELIDIRGIIDALYLDGTNAIRGLEIKSCGKLPSEIKRPHRMQAVTYAAITGFEFDVLYVSRDIPWGSDQVQLAQFPVNCDEAEMKANLTSHALAYLAVGERKLPPIPQYFRSESDCEYCPFITECWDGPERLPELSSGELKAVLAKADDIAYNLLERRSHRHSGIIKYLRQSASPEARALLTTVGE